MPIHWYPSHMAAAEKALGAALPRIDVVIEVLDARLPRSSSNPVLARLAKAGNDKPRILALNKADLADAAITRAWIGALSSPPAVRAVALEATDRGRVRALLPIAREMAPARGTPIKPLRLLVAGIPNSGKSTLINSLVGRKVARTGDEPGITKGQQWIRLEPSIQLADTPGLLWPRIDDEDAGFRLAASGAVRDTSMEEEEVARFAIAFLVSRYGERLRDRYGITPEVLATDPGTILDAIGVRRGCLVAGGKVERNKAAQILLKELRSGALGRISFEEPPG